MIWGFTHGYCDYNFRANSSDGATPFLHDILSVSRNTYLGHTDNKSFVSIITFRLNSSIC